jgi:hypothetical protein
MTSGLAGFGLQRRGNRCCLFVGPLPQSSISASTTSGLSSRNSVAMLLPCLANGTVVSLWGGLRAADADFGMAPVQPSRPRSYVPTPFTRLCHHPQNNLRHLRAPPSVNSVWGALSVSGCCAVGIGSFLPANLPPPVPSALSFAALLHLAWHQ